jgi:protocatechuate 4,5-dioxygenase beta chain
MAKLVGAFCVPHIPLITSQPEVVSKKQHKKVSDAFARIRARLVELEVDTAIIVGDDHYTAFGPHCLPSMLIGIGDVEGPIEDWLRHDRAPIASNPTLARHIMHYGHDRNFDWAAAKSLTVDHSIFIPYVSLIKDIEGIRTIPVYVAAGVTPLIRPRRCVELGAMIGEAIASYEGAERVAIIGTGGLSHWVGMTEMGDINVAFDHAILDMVARRDLDALVELDDEEVIRTAGNGALEYRNWLVAIASLKAYDFDLICYEAIHPWVTGSAFVELRTRPESRA